LAASLLTNGQIFPTEPVGKEPAAEHGNAATTTTQRAAPAAAEAAASGGIKAPSIPVNPVSCQCGFVFVSGGFGPLLSNHGTVDTYNRKLHLFSSPVHPQPARKKTLCIFRIICLALCFDQSVRYGQDLGDFNVQKKSARHSHSFCQIHADTCVCATCRSNLHWIRKRIEMTKQINGTKGEGYKDR
jgi:hypothetical protein